MAGTSGSKHLRWQLLLLALVTAAVIPTALAQKKVVRFLHNETDPPSIEYFNQAIATFEAAHPDIDVQMEAVSSDGRLQKVTASINARTMPEVFKILPEERQLFVRNGYLEPLDDIVASIGAEDFAAGSVSQIDGHYYNLPYTMGNFHTLWYRKDLLAAKGIEPPTTWAELLTAAEALTEDTNGDGQPDIYGFVIPAAQTNAANIFFAGLLWSAGGSFFDADFNVSFDSPATIEALTFLKQIASYAPPGISSYSYGEMANAYLTEAVAMDLYSGRLIANVALNTPELMAVTGAVPAPAGPSGFGAKFSSADSFAVASASVGAKNVAEGKVFLEFLMSPEQMTAFSMTAFPHLIPPRKSVQATMVTGAVPAAFEDHRDLAEVAFDTSNGFAFDTEAGFAVTENGLVATGDINPYVGPIIARNVPATVVQMVLLQGAEPADAAAWGQAEMERLVDEMKAAE